MLSKSQARGFFLAGTGLFSAIFIWLTIDTLKQVPTLTNQREMTPQVIRGKHLFDSKNCMGCHTILGEGGYYAPELTKVYERRGATFIDLILQDPEKLFPGERRMPKYDFTPEERGYMIDFLQWIGNVNTQGFPKDPPLGKQFIINPPKDAQGKVLTALPENPSPSVAKPAVFDKLCIACHAIGGKGGMVGPALDGISQTRDKDWMKSWLEDPGKIKPGTTMPKLPLSATEVQELVDYLHTL